MGIVVNTEHMIVPIPGCDLDTFSDAFNFFLSQLRIRVEMAFGILINRWGVLWKRLSVQLRHVPALILCLFRLHNFCIDEGETAAPNDAPEGIDRPMSASLIEENQHECLVLCGNQEDFRTMYTFQRRVDGTTLRDVLVANIRELNYERPQANRVRNQETNA